MTSAPTANLQRLAALVCLADSYSPRGYDLTQLELQALAYLLDHSGRGPQLRWTFGEYGPSSTDLEELRPGLGEYLTSEPNDWGRTVLRLRPETLPLARKMLEADTAMARRAQRVAQVIAGFEMPWGLELLAVTHWAGSLVAADAEAVLSTARALGNRPGQPGLLEAGDVAVVLAHLQRLGWLTAGQTGTP